MSDSPNSCVPELLKIAILEERLASLQAEVVEIEEYVKTLDGQIEDFENSIKVAHEKFIEKDFTPVANFVKNAKIGSIVAAGIFTALTGFFMWAVGNLSALGKIFGVDKWK